MYTPPAFVVDDTSEIHAMMRACRIANFITATAEGPVATPLPMFLDAGEGDCGTLYAHLARPNPQWKMPVIGNGLAVFMGPDAYITPAWYAAKAEHGKVVPTWNYTAVQAEGPVEFFDDTARLLDVVKRLTDLHEAGAAKPWAVSDAPPAFIAAQLRGIVGIRMPITHLTGKRKLSQNRSEPDRVGIRNGLAESHRDLDHTIASMIPVPPSSS
ncbi:Protease synthase and sporulation protein PAI 2 [Ensifer sp. M14]|jgi:transcriptional regulator|uniref:FMN-binding negative transcriptional regulator n=1 Tax=Sinorhizobium/Ensifer group TaxID=227292 RepID=UPI00098432DE|nr:MULTISPECIES: FMN-binding negative transcriptional regulator [Sinorhizobium/Ensifer group]OOG70861.1 transcriptional regulator [Sinorhizobium sp. A49]RDL48760.1 Protease synthase and sporulation protein PAI 2 [Ensifer sp. M14]